MNSPTVDMGLFHVLGFQIVVSTPDEVIIEWDVDDRHRQPYGVVHGGVYCSAVEAAASLGAANWLAGRVPVVGVSNRTDFVRAVGDGRLRVRATPVFRDDSAQLWQVEIQDQHQRLVARGEVRLQALAPWPLHDRDLAPEPLDGEGADR